MYVCKGSVHLTTRPEGSDGEYRFSVTLSLTLLIDGVGGQRHAPAALPQGKGPGTDCTGVWVCPTAGLDGCGKSGRHGDSILKPLSP